MKWKKHIRFQKRKEKGGKGGPKNVIELARDEAETQRIIEVKILPKSVKIPMRKWYCSNELKPKKKFRFDYSKK